MKILYQYRYARLSMSCFVMLFALILVLLNSCKDKDEVFPAPTISFKTGDGFINSDTTILIGDSVKIGIIASTNSNDELTHFHYSAIFDSIENKIDTGIYTNSFDYNKILVKGIAENEKWEFYVRDKAGRQSKTIFINIKKDPNSIFTNLKFVPSVILGLPENIVAGGFYSLQSNLVYTQNEAFNNQSDIDLLYFFDIIDGEDNTIASPGASLDASVFTGETGLDNWGTKNTTRFVYQENISTQAFDDALNDSLILATSFVFATGKRKCKNLTSGDIYAFETENTGTKGLFKVLGVNSDNKTIEISLKIKE